MKRALIVATAVFLLGCNTGPQQDPAVGQYVLKTVNGITLPANLGVAGGKTTQVVTGSVFIDPDGGYQKLMYLQLTQTGTATTQEDMDTGRWRRSGSSLTFTVSTSSSGGGGYAGSLSGSTLTLTQSGIIGVYEKADGGGFCSRCL
jgi:hypothetical protein